jgi:hypothetical protein
MLTPLLTNGDGVVDNVGAGERVVIAVGAHIDPVVATRKRTRIPSVSVVELTTTCEARRP